MLSIALVAVTLAATCAASSNPTPRTTPRRESSGSRLIEVRLWNKEYKVLKPAFLEDDIKIADVLRSAIVDNNEAAVYEVCLGSQITPEIYQAAVSVMPHPINDAAARLAWWTGKNQLVEAYIDVAGQAGRLDVLVLMSHKHHVTDEVKKKIADYFTQMSAPDNFEQLEFKDYFAHSLLHAASVVKEKGHDQLATRLATIAVLRKNADEMYKNLGEACKTINPSIALNDTVLQTLGTTDVLAMLLHIWMDYNATVEHRMATIGVIKSFANMNGRHCVAGNCDPKIGEQPRAVAASKAQKHYNEPTPALKLAVYELQKQNDWYECALLCAIFPELKEEDVFKKANSTIKQIDNAIHDVLHIKNHADMREIITRNPAEMLKMHGTFRYMQMDQRILKEYLPYECEPDMWP